MIARNGQEALGDMVDGWTMRSMVVETPSVIVDSLDDDVDDGCPAGPFYFGLLATSTSCFGLGWVGTRVKMENADSSRFSGFPHKSALTPRKRAPFGFWFCWSSSFPTLFALLSRRVSVRSINWGRGPVCPPQSTTLDASHSRAPLQQIHFCAPNWSKRNVHVPCTTRTRCTHLPCGPVPCNSALPQKDVSPPR